MGFGHRRLMDDDDSPAPSIESPTSNQTINETLSVVCQPFCNPVNDSGYCLSPCLNVCPTYCHYSFPPPVTYDYSPPPPPPAGGSRRVSPLLITTFVALSLAVLIVLGYVVYARFYGRRGNRGGRNRAQQQRAVPPQDNEILDDLGPVLDHPIWYIRTIGLQPSVISKIAVYNYKRGEGLIEGTECSVCLTEFEEDETLRLLPKCSHAFHLPCIDTWLRSHTNCPNCRAPIVTGNPRSPSPEPSNDNNSWEEIGLDQGSDDVGGVREIESETQNRGEAEEETEQPRADHRLEDAVDDSKNGMQPIRRSVSVDSLSAAKINLAVVDFLRGNLMRKPDSRLTDEDSRDSRSKGFAGSSSSSVSSRSVQFLAGSSSSMTRSVSWSGRFLGSKCSRNRTSLLPL